MKKGNIYLIGFMGTGKSSAARLLSGLTGRPYLEMDDEIVKAAGCPINDIFAAEGEEGFRARETRMLRQIAAGGPQIVSCGGGVVLREENVDIMKESGLIVLLTAAPETILERVRTSTHRPILNGHMETGYIRDLMQKRESYYEKAADRVVITDQRTSGEVAAAIRELLPDSFMEDF